MLPDNPVELRKMDKEAIIKAIFEGVTYSVPNLVKDKFGNSIEQTDKTYDAYTGNLLSKRLVTWTYHDAKVGNVKDVITEEFYEEGSLKAVLVSRYTTDPMEQPVIMGQVTFAKPIEEIITK